MDEALQRTLADLQPAATALAKLPARRGRPGRRVARRHRQGSRRGGQDREARRASRDRQDRDIVHSDAGLTDPSSRTFVARMFGMMQP